MRGLEDTVVIVTGGGIGSASCRRFADGGRAGYAINTASDAARVDSSGESADAFCKDGRVSFAKTMARELARTKINVNVVSRGADRHRAVQSSRISAASSAGLVTARQCGAISAEDRLP